MAKAPDFKAPQEQPKQENKATQAFYVTNVFGPMHHPFMNIKIDGRTLVPEIDGWLQSQIDAGKVTVE